MISNFYNLAKTFDVSQWFSVQEEFISSNKKLNAQMLENIENERKLLKKQRSVLKVKDAEIEAKEIKLKKNKDKIDWVIIT